MGQNRPLIVYFCPFHNGKTDLTINDKSVVGVLGTRTRSGRMEGTDESTELRRHPTIEFFVTQKGRD